MFAEKISAAVTDRKALAGAVATLGEGHRLIVTKLDRLARSIRDLLNTLAEIARAGATFRSLGDPWADTTTPHGRLMLTVLGGLAEFERHSILAKTTEGRKRAQTLLMRASLHARTPIAWRDGQSSLPTDLIETTLLRPFRLSFPDSASSTLVASSSMVKGFFRARCCSAASSLVGPTYPVI